MKTSLQSLSPELLGLVEGQLSNNEDSSDDELVQYFIQSGLTEVQSRDAISFRPRYRINVYFAGHTPIRNGGIVLRFNPHKGEFEAD